MTNHKELTKQLTNITNEQHKLMTQERKTYINNYRTTKTNNEHLKVRKNVINKDKTK